MYFNVFQLIKLQKTSKISVLQKYSKDKEKNIRCIVAANENCPIEILEELDVKTTVANNKNCPNHVLEKLSEDVDMRVLFVVVENNKTTLNALKKLHDKYEHLRFDIECHPNWV